MPDVIKSCTNCPSLLMTPQDRVGILQKDIGAPVCARFGNVLGNRDSKSSEVEGLGRIYAKDCDKFGEPKPNVAPWSMLTLRVALPDPSALKPDDQRINPDDVSSCRMCENFIREDIGFKQLGYNSGVCAAKGTLILPSRQTFEAKGCEYSSMGMVRNSSHGLTVLPEYAQVKRGDADPLANHIIQRSKNFVDPSEYLTDKPVLSSDQVMIRAWRSVFDPATENEVYLPIFNRDYFSAEEQALIPKTGDEEHPEDYVDHNFYTYKVAVLWQELDETPALWGQPGTGKTELFRHMAWLMQMPFYRFSITARTELEDMAGSKEYSPERGTWYRYGRFVQAWTKPCVCVVDEPNAGPDEVWHFFRPLTDNSKQLVLDQNEGEHLPRHDFCYLGMAMNPPWDARNSGIKQIADADARRLHHMFVDLPPVEIERDIIRTRIAHDGWELSGEQMENVIAIGEDIRSMVRNDTLPISWGIAMQLKVSRLLRWFDYKSAYRMTAGDFLEPEAMQVLIDTVANHVDK